VTSESSRTNRLEIKLARTFTLLVAAWLCACTTGRSPVVPRGSRVALKPFSVAPSAQSELSRAVAATLRTKFEQIVRHADRIELVGAGAEPDADYLLTILLTRVAQSDDVVREGGYSSPIYRCEASAVVGIVPTAGGDAIIHKRRMELISEIPVSGTIGDRSHWSPGCRALVLIQGEGAATDIALELGFATWSSINRLHTQ